MMLSLAAALLSAAAAAPARPNVVFVMADDHAAHAISAYGSRVSETPNIDRLAREGMLFRNVFATNSICTPSRASILTGTYSHKNGVPVFNRFDGSQTTVAKLLQAAGDHTGMIGKWHLGSDPTGFDHWEILPGQGVYNDPVLYTATGEKTYTGHYATDVITDLGIEFVRDRPKDRPFFLMLHHKAPHREWIPDEKHRRMFETRVIPEAPTFWDDYSTRTDALHENRQRVADDMTNRDLKLEPPAGLEGAARQAWLGQKPTEVTITVGGKPTTLTGKDLARWKYQRYMQDYLACVQSIDDNVGRLLDFLKESGLERDTIVVYTSDQGFFLGDHGLYDKRFMYEESLRMPPTRSPSTWTSRPLSWRRRESRCRPRCRAAAWCRSCAARRPGTGGRRCTTATTTTPATTTPAPTTASARRPTSSSTSGRRTSGSSTTCARTPPS
jgi:arylsulfatase A-like enzyme